MKHGKERIEEEFGRKGYELKEKKIVDRNNRKGKKQP